MKPIKAWAILQTEDVLHKWFHPPGAPILYPTREKARVGCFHRKNKIQRDLGYSLYQSIRPVRVTITVE